MCTELYNHCISFLYLSFFACGRGGGGDLLDMHGNQFNLCIFIDIVLVINGYLRCLSFMSKKLRDKVGYLLFNVSCKIYMKDSHQI